MTLYESLVNQLYQGLIEPERPPSPDFFDWYKRTIPGNYEVPRHVEWICKELVQPVIDGDLTRLILSVPPQHAKSDTITRRLPVYWGEFFPGENVLLTGYNQTFAEQQLSLPARNLAADRGVLGAQATALKSWKFKGGGAVTVRGVGSPPTGVPRLKLIIIDDPIKSREEASSTVFRERLWNWYTGSIVQRFWPDTRVIIIATRWHEDDLLGRLAEKHPGEYRVVNLAAIAGKDDPLGRAEGEALWPAQKPIEFLLEQKAASSPYEFEALFQGNPTPREGSFFKPSKIELVDVIPSGLTNCLAWDLAASEDSGDWTAAVHMFGPDKNGLYYLDVERFRKEPSERNERIRQCATRRQPRRVRGPQDPGAAGKEAAQTFVKLHAGFSVVTKPVSGNKQLRAEPLAAQVNAGNIRLKRSEFSDDFLEEFRQFPNGKNDDWVDAGSDAFAEVASVPDDMMSYSMPPVNEFASVYQPDFSEYQPID